MVGPIEVLADGSFLSKVFEVANFKRRGGGLVVRVVEYTLDDGRDNDNVYQLITTILDPHDVTAEDLALAYEQRWEIETVLDELKTHQRGPRTVLRSKSPSLVRQEIWGHLCCHYAIRTLMFEAAHDANVDPDRVSFVGSLRIARRSIAARGFSPQPTDEHGWRHAIVLLCRRLNPIGRRRGNPRLVKRKYTRWHVKRVRHHQWPQPDNRPPKATVRPPN
jgi:Transposase DDE domain